MGLAVSTDHQQLRASRDRLGRIAAWIARASSLSLAIALLLIMALPWYHVRIAGDIARLVLVLFFGGVLGGTLALALGVLTWRKGAIVLGAVAMLGSGLILPSVHFGPPDDVSEASAIGALRAINSAESTYQSACAEGGYAQSLEDLARPPRGSDQGFTAPDLSTNGVIRSGYVVTLRRDASAVTVAPASKSCNSAAADSVSSYFAEAHPIASGTRHRSFATDARGVIYFNMTGAVIEPGMAGTSELQ